MNDRIAGTTWDNPIWYGKFRIWATNQHPFARGTAFAYVHDDCDGNENDGRFGYCESIDECKAEIDERWPNSDKL